MIRSHLFPDVPMTRISPACPRVPGSAHALAAQRFAFEQYDGTDIHWGRDRDLGWYAFGMRRNRYDPDERGISEFDRLHPEYPEAVSLFHQDFGDPLEQVLRTDTFADSDEVVVFTECLRPSSFAGHHRDADIKRMVFFDLQTCNGIMLPAQFVKTFGSLPIARVVYQGRLSGRFINDAGSGSIPHRFQKRQHCVQQF